MSVDPLVATTGDPYLYGAGNPSTLSDPSGLDPGWAHDSNPCNDAGYYNCRTNGSSRFDILPGRAGIGVRHRAESSATANENWWPNACEVVDCYQTPGPKSPASTRWTAGPSGNVTAEAPAIVTVPCNFMECDIVVTVKYGGGNTIGGGAIDAPFHLPSQQGFGGWSLLMGGLGDSPSQSFFFRRRPAPTSLTELWRDSLELGINGESDVVSNYFFQDSKIYLSLAMTANSPTFSFNISYNTMDEAIGWAGGDQVRIDDRRLGAL